MLLEYCYDKRLGNLDPWVDVVGEFSSSDTALPAFIHDADLNDGYYGGYMLEELEKMAHTNNTHIEFGGHRMNARIEGDRVIIETEFDEIEVIGECILEQFKKAIEGFQRLLSLPRSLDTKFVLEI